MNSDATPITSRTTANTAPRMRTPRKFGSSRLRSAGTAANHRGILNFFCAGSISSRETTVTDLRRGGCVGPLIRWCCARPPGGLTARRRCVVQTGNLGRIFHCEGPALGRGMACRRNSFGRGLCGFDDRRHCV
jgi:hypothetical protein